MLCTKESRNYQRAGLKSHSTEIQQLSNQQSTQTRSSLEVTRVAEMHVYITSQPWLRYQIVSPLFCSFRPEISTQYSQVSKDSHTTTC